MNFGGGHHITRDDYDRELLIKLVRSLRQIRVEVYLEPGEAVALNAGYLVTRVLDIVHNDIDIAILDTSAACHMPDVLEMPYRPPLYDSGLRVKKHMITGCPQAPVSPGISLAITALMHRLKSRRQA